jgi:gamma-glutamylcyclotransferase (GGCT)/AIG2-like uncharacterized protein YtfP
MRLFVYGTLMNGQESRHVLGDAGFIGDAHTIPAFTLLDLGSYPAMVHGGNVSVRGETYEIDPISLAKVDDFEGHPTLFRRSSIWLQDGSEVQAYLFARPPGSPSRRIPGGDWRRRQP